MGFIVTWASDTWLSLGERRTPGASPVEHVVADAAGATWAPAAGDRSRTPLQDTPHRRRPLAVLATCLALLASCASCASSCQCGRSGATGHDEGALAQQKDVDLDIARARAIAERRAPLPDRSETLAMVESIQARAVREGDGPRAQALYAL